MDGILPIAKPLGLVSKDVSRKILKLFGKIKIGHAGTLDPLASGVLPILLGKATKLQDFLIQMPKAYEFDVTFGYETSTLDAEGEVVERGPAVFERDVVESAVLSFRGPISQIPPIYSAVKHLGKPLYAYARDGIEIENFPLGQFSRDVEIYGIELLGFTGSVASIAVRCSKGTYVRSLARDISKALGTCGTVTRLVRTVSAGIALAESISMERLEQDPSLLAAFLRPIERLELPVSSVNFLDNFMVSRLKNGLPVTLDRVSFHQMIIGKSPQPIAQGSDLLLIDPGERAFGIGSVHEFSSEHIVIRMRRGL